MNNTMVREIHGAKINPKLSFKNQDVQNTRGRKLREQIRYFEPFTPIITFILRRMFINSASVVYSSAITMIVWIMQLVQCLGYGLDDLVSIFYSANTSPFSKRPNWVWDLPSLLLNGYWGRFRHLQSGRSLNVTYFSPSVVEVRNEWG